MKIAKRIEINNSHYDKLFAILIIDEKTSYWILQIETNNEIIKVKVSATTVLVLMNAERQFKANSTNFYEV